jgi:hypothetical protein
MSVINSQPLIGASGNQGGAYNLTRSLRFRSSASAYLNRTPASAGNRKTWTYSAWVKRGTLSSRQCLLQIETGSNNNTVFAIELRSDDKFALTAYDLLWRESTQVLRDPSAWYHLVAAIDTTQATAANRIKMYVNGSQITSFTTSNDPSQNADLGINQASAHAFGRNNNNSLYFDGYIAETNFVDGQQLTPSSFGETSTTTGVWIPKAYTGSYGTNGFYLDFEDTSSVAALGYDAAGSNDWTVNNVSLTAGTTYDSMTDVPTLTSATAANYCVLNPLDTGMSISGGNLNSSSSSTNTINRSTIGVSSGKWYWEVTQLSANEILVGIANASASLTAYLGSNANGWSYNSANGSKYNNGSGVAYGATYTTNDVIGVALDMDAGTLTFYKNNTTQGQAYSGLTGTIFPSISAGTTSTSLAVNFGQRPFAYTPPSGFVALNTFNLPTPTIGATASTQANKYFDAKLYTGTGSSLNVTGLSFQPDLVWIKERNGAADHALYDAVRGVQKQLESNTTTAETTETTGLTALNSDGFTVGSLAQVNTNTDTYVAWAWDANGAGSSNTAGSITSTVSANTSAGFSIVKYAGTLSAAGTATVGHGLGVAPVMIISKGINQNANWAVHHNYLSTANKYLRLNTTDAEADGAIYGSITVPTSTVFTTNYVTGYNESGYDYVAYCFAEVAGYSKFGSYTGNGSTDGVFVYTGFRPKFVMFKRTDSAASWLMLDTSRNTYNVMTGQLYANASVAEDNTTATADFLSNGIKIRETGGGTNASGATYIYMAFAETPQKFALGR